MEPTTSTVVATAVIAFAAFVQATATVVLVIVTRRYVMLTGKLAQSAEAQIRLSEEQIRLSTTPNLLFEGAEGDWRIINLGPYSAHIRAVHVEELSSDEVVVGRGLLITDGHILWKWNRVIGPNQEIDIRQVLVPNTGGGSLSGLVRLVFYFVYGPTGPRTHALDVKLRVHSIYAATVHGQNIRLDEAPPQLPPTSINQIQPVARS